VLVHNQRIECIVRSECGILRKFRRFRVVMRKNGDGKEPLLAKKEEENIRSARLFRYRDSLEQIQGEYQ